MLDTITQMTWLMTVLNALLIFLVGWVCVHLINRGFSRIKTQRNLNLKFLNSALVGLVWLICIVQIIGLVPGMSKLTQTVLAGSGIAAVVLGLAAQESFGNLISGVIIAIFHPFQVGDLVHLIDSDLTGFVEDITLRHTVIRTYTNSRIIIPNSVMSTEKIENSDYADSAVSGNIDVTVSYECDLDRAMALMAEVIGGHTSFYDTRTKEQKDSGAPKVKVFVRELGDNGIELRAGLWTKTAAENFGACSDARIAVKKAFDEAGIEIPCQKLVVLKR